MVLIFAKKQCGKDDEIQKDSVQFYALEKFRKEGYDLIYNDDGSGEAADLVCVREDASVIELLLVHCKYSKTNDPSGRLDNLVAVL